MPAFESQSPNLWGWKSGPAASIVPYSYRGNPFPAGVAAGTVHIWNAALDRLTAAGWSLPNPDPSVGGCWGYQDRQKVSGHGLSFHAYGLALDLAAPWNPYGGGVPKASPYRLPLNTGALVRDLGLAWGGDWTSTKDWMHLELHLSPREASEIGAPTLFAVGSSSGTPLGPYPLPAGYYFGPRSGPANSVSNQVSTNPQWKDALARAQDKLGIASDGRYGPDTAAATERWQRNHGLKVDGLIGPSTWASLSAA